MILLSAPPVLITVISFILHKALLLHILHLLRGIMMVQSLAKSDITSRQLEQLGGLHRRDDGIGGEETRPGQHILPCNPWARRVRTHTPSPSLFLNNSIPLSVMDKVGMLDIQNWASTSVHYCLGSP